jgi:cytochrome c553
MMQRLTHFLGALAGALMLATATAAPDPALLKRGEYVARAGDCIACHSAPGKPAFAGGT